MQISRRRLLETVFRLPLAAVLGTAFSGEAAATQGGPPRVYFLNRFTIAGFQYYRGPALVRTRTGRHPPLRTGTKLVLTPETGNPFDEFAVRIDCRGTPIGYVPRSDNRHISRLLQQGARLYCEVIEVNPTGPPWRMVRVGVGMEG